VVTTTGDPPPTIGISYSGGGPLLAIELGIARAFVQFGIRPAVITGASAGAIAGAAHALDMYAGTGIDAAVDELGRMSNATLKLDAGDFVFRILREGAHTKGIGDNAPAADIISRVVQRLNLSNVTLGSFGQPLTPGGATSPRLHIVATELATEQAFWFDGQASLPDALVASSAIPGVFPWRTYAAPTGTVFLVDGGVVDNQPLTKLKDEGCDRIYACAVGGTPLANEPDNLIDNCCARSI
jgi:NTE family protein